MEDLQDSILHSILANTDAKTTTKFACVNKRLRSVTSDDLPWSLFCAQDFAVSSLLDPYGTPCSTFKETYIKWHDAFGMYPLSIVKRAKHIWDTIRNWTSIHFPEVVDTLAPGASEEEISKVEECLGWQLPVPLRVLYRFCNGQLTLDHGFSQKKHLAALGLLGGYQFYEHKANVHLLSWNNIMRLTKLCVPHLGLPSGSKYIVVAASSNFTKFFFLNCFDGQLYVGTGRDQNQLMPCVPSALVDMAQQDAMLLWLEEYGRKLQGGMFSVRKDGNIRSISLFPEKEPLCSKAVTNGVQVRGSAVFVPEFSDVRRDGDKYLFCYSIRMCLLHQENISQDRIFSSCQLSRRHWIIRANDNIIDEVCDEGVIGEYPLLREGGDEFVYESCSGLPSSGSIEGDFTFVPGRLSKPEGPEFTVQSGFGRHPFCMKSYFQLHGGALHERSSSSTTLIHAKDHAQLLHAILQIVLQVKDAINKRTRLILHEDFRSTWFSLLGFHVLTTASHL